MKVLRTLAAALLLASARASNDTSADTCEPFLWGSLLEDWATAPGSTGRQGRVMSLPPTKGYYVSERIDLLPPPPPAPQPAAPPRYAAYDEWQATPPPAPDGKIVNRPLNPYKDKFKPSYPPPSQNLPIPLQQHPQHQQPLHQQQQHHQPSPHQQPPYQQQIQHQQSPYQQQQQHLQPAYQQQHQQRPAADRVDAAATPHKQASETDLYLLTAIEKLVYRVDLMEKRLRKMEETMHYLVVGKDTKPEPCTSNFTRVGAGCYYFSPDAGDWKAASLRCRKLRAHLLELDSDDEKRTVLSSLLANNKLKGTDWWTGGLNPGLLWIWSHSARPVAHNATAGNSTASAAAIVGEGRCLALVHDAALAAYTYRGQDCSLRHHFVCEMPEEKAKLSNDIERAARELRALGAGARTAKVAWPDRLLSL